MSQQRAFNVRSRTWCVQPAFAWCCWLHTDAQQSVQLHWHCCSFVSYDGVVLHYGALPASVRPMCDAEGLACIPLRRLQHSSLAARNGALCPTTTAAQPRPMAQSVMQAASNQQAGVVSPCSPTASAAASLTKARACQAPTCVAGGAAPAASFRLLCYSRSSSTAETHLAVAAAHSSRPQAHHSQQLRHSPSRHTHSSSSNSSSSLSSRWGRVHHKRCSPARPHHLSSNHRHTAHSSSSHTSRRHRSRCPIL